MSANNGDNLQPNNEIAQKKSKNLLVVWIVLGVVIVSGLLTTIYVLSNKDNKAPVKTSDQAATKPFSTDTASSNAPTADALVNDKDLQKDRGDLERFLQSPFDPETASPGPQFTQFNIKPGGKFRMTVNYSSVGDQKMAKGTLYVKMGQNLSLVPGSMIDSFMDNPNQQVGDNVYDSTKNEIRFGPGTKDAAFAELQPSQRGKFVFDVQMSPQAKSGDTVRLYSYINDEGGKSGKVDLIFFKVM